MIKTTVKVGGMACGMCESHINDVIRKVFPEAQKVTSSHKKGEATFLTENAVDPEKLKDAIEETGYHYLGASSETYKKKGLFGGLFG
jgi:copper chaperone CopZ